MTETRSPHGTRIVRVGIDTGGTFTDFHVFDPRGEWVFKVPSTTGDPSVAVLAGLAKILGRVAGRLGRSIGRGGDPADAARSRGPGDRTRGSRSRFAVEVVHGTTVGTNAILTHRAARTVFVTTEGFEDLVEIGRQSRESLYDLLASRMDPLVPRELRFGVRERVFPESPARSSLRSRHSPGVGAGAVSAGSQRSLRGSRIVPSNAEIVRLAARVRGARPASIAVGFLHSGVDPSNERLVGGALARLGVPVTLSHRVSPEYREYERFQTTIANASLRPVLGPYLERLSNRARPARISILQSDATTATAHAAAEEPVRTVLSGPAGGALAALALAKRLGDRRVLTLDMGGTSTDAALIDGDLSRATIGRIAGIPIRTPMIEVHTVGAGGGSIARRDAAGALRVGPESAGADPGPACYAKARFPTVTDAHLVLGTLGPDDLLGGDFRIDADRSRLALSRLARSLDIGTERTAEGVLRVVEATMERALRAISIERGHDPRRFALYAFGGAGGLHACALAERLGITRIVIPKSPGVFSATGLASAAAGVEVATTLLASPYEQKRIALALRALERLALGRLRKQGIDANRVRLGRFGDLRYRGQSHEITVPFGPRATREFEHAHRRRYGHAREGAPVEIVTLRVRARGPAPRLPRGIESVRDGLRPRAVRAVERVFHHGRFTTCRIMRRADLTRGEVVAGPARIAEYSATTFVAAGWEAHLGPVGVLLLTPRSRRQATDRGASAYFPGGNGKGRGGGRSASAVSGRERPVLQSRESAGVKRARRPGRRSGGGQTDEAS